jgi:hypothetical protein
VTLLTVEATTADELDTAFASATAQHADAIMVFGSPLTFQHAPRIVALAAKHHLPANYHARQFATNGGLIVYGPDYADVFRRAGGYVDKILKGAKPSDLPVEQPTKFELDDRFHEACVMDQADWWNGRVVGGFLVCARRNEELYYGRMAASGRIGHER